MRENGWGPHVIHLELNIAAVKCNDSPHLVFFQAWLDQQRANRQADPVHIEMHNYCANVSSSVIATNLSFHLPITTHIIWEKPRYIVGRLPVPA
jgi:hypothetical protein